MTYCSGFIHIQEGALSEKTDKDKRFLLSLSLYKSTKIHISREAIAFYPYTSYIVQSFAPKGNPVDQLSSALSMYKR